jgi:hypothetical protein
MILNKMAVRCYDECPLCCVLLTLSITYAEYHSCWLALMLSVTMLSVAMLSVTYAECHLCWVSLMLSIIMLSVTHAEYYLCCVSLMLSITYAEYHLCWVSLMLSITYAEYHLCWVSLMLSITHAECHSCWVSLMLSVTHGECHSCWVSLMLSVTCKPFMLSVIMLSAVMQSVVAPVRHCIMTFCNHYLKQGRSPLWPSTLSEFYLPCPEIFNLGCYYMIATNTLAYHHLGVS